LYPNVRHGTVAAMTTTSISAAIYTRVSSAKQVETGHSLDEQDKRCRAFAAAQGWAVDERHVYVEKGVSGGKSSRPALDAMKAAAESGEFQAVVAADMDRLGRSPANTMELLELFDRLGIRPYDPTGRCFAADDPGAKMTRGVIALAAGYERDMISERSRRSSAAKRERGSYQGGPRPYGYAFSDDGGLVIREDEAAIVRRLFREYNDGASLRGIANNLNAEGIVGPLGGAWSQSRVASRLDLGLYAGFVGGGKQGNHVPIIDAATWERTRTMRAATADRTGRATGGRHANVHLLGNGLLRCQCGGSMYPRRDTRSSRDVYRCRSRDSRTTDCNMPPLPRDAVDGAVRAYLSDRVLSPGLAEGELAAATKAAAREAAAAAAQAKRDATAAQGKLRNGQLAMLDDEPPFTPGEWSQIKGELQAALTEAKTREAEADRVAAALKAPSADLTAAVEAIRAAARGEAEGADTVAAQRAAITRIFSYFEVLAAPVDPDEPSEAPDAMTAQQQAAVDESLAGEPPGFEFKPQRGWPRQRVMIVPVPRPEIAARFGGGTPMDALAELRPNVAQDLPWRYASGPS
jgi:site-specific DNA recombinase